MEQTVETDYSCIHRGLSPLCKTTYQTDVSIEIVVVGAQSLPWHNLYLLVCAMTGPDFWVCTRLFLVACSFLQASIRGLEAGWSANGRNAVRGGSFLEEARAILLLRPYVEAYLPYLIK